MIGHYLATLTEAQEDRVLTVPFGPVFVSSIEGVAEWHLGARRFDGQPPLDAFVNVPLWALERVWDRFTSPPEVRVGRPPGDPNPTERA